MNTKNKNKIELHARVIRKDGTIEELGKISEVKKVNFLNRLINKIRTKLWELMKWHI